MDETQRAELWDDDAGVKLADGTLAQMKTEYLRRDLCCLFIELEDGTQLAWNAHREPPGWDEI